MNGYTTSSKTDEEWATIIRTQRESGLSVAKFCRQNSINQQTFYRHRSQLESQKLQEVADDFMKVEVSRAMAMHNLEAPQSPTALSLQIGKATLSLTENTSPLWVAKLIR
ncbi:IS66 family insertion sequence element accessory protein TnpA [Vibrio hyugaensis]|uniref:IS66 family insertion sequence element accessory protein TnpA n=1 Tax=Vibrio hyugaensis TaxID=1534743 RepID=UPI0005EE0CED|nr:transposase [Vibrio hyugaensis]